MTAVNSWAEPSRLFNVYVNTCSLHVFCSSTQFFFMSECARSSILGNRGLLVLCINKSQILDAAQVTVQGGGQPSKLETSDIKTRPIRLTY